MSLVWGGPAPGPIRCGPVLTGHDEQRERMRGRWWGGGGQAPEPIDGAGAGAGLIHSKVIRCQGMMG